MIRIADCRAVAAVFIAEVRSVARTATTWLLTVLAVGAGIALYISRTTAVNDNWDSPTRASIDPHLLAAPICAVTLWLSVAGLILNATWAARRDHRDRMHEALGARPYSNFALLAGRCAAHVVIAYLAILLLVASIEVAAAGANRFGIPVTGFEYGSLAVFVFVDAPVALFFWCAAVMLLGEALGNRLAAAILLAGLAGHVWIVFNTPLYLVPIVSGIDGLGAIASNWTSLQGDAELIVHRASVALVALGAIAAAAALHRRADDQRRRAVCACAFLVPGGALAVAALAVESMQDMSERDAWARVHSDLAYAHRADVEHVEAFATITPGELLEVRGQIALRTQTDAESTLLSFNPGLRMHHLHVDGQEVPVDHKFGLLRVALPSSEVERRVVGFHASGVPDPRFAYLDSALDSSRRTLANSQLHLLGTQASMFNVDYVALMPGVRWLPMPGANFEPRSDHSPGDGRLAHPQDKPTGAGCPDWRPITDFFDVDIRVELPGDYLVAGPGRRYDERSETPGYRRYRFSPSAPVSEVAVLAARFASRQREIDGTSYELLAHPNHVAEAEFSGKEIEDTLAPVLRRSTELGFPYPLGGLSLVEVPSDLRVYGGGERMDTVQAMPGILLVREPAYRNLIRWRSRRSDEPANWWSAFTRLTGYFGRDYAGGDLAFAVRNLLRFQTSAAGAGAFGIDELAEELAKRLLVPTRTPDAGMFSAHLFAVDRPTAALPSNLTSRLVGSTMDVSDAAHRELQDPSVWERAIRLDPARSAMDPGTCLSAMVLRARVQADAVLDLFGAEKAGRLLAGLRHRHAGSSFAAANLVALASEIDPSLAQVLRDWIHATSPPGFVASPATVTRLGDDDMGRPRYHVSVHVRNDEPAPGIVRLRCLTSSQFDPTVPECAAIARVAGHQSVEIGIVADGPPVSLSMDTYLARNPKTTYLSVPRQIPTTPSLADRFVGVGPSNWQPSDDGIVIDDLDDGFQIDALTGEAKEPWGLQWRRRNATEDRGFPGSRHWSRRDTRWSWGKYRRTVSIVSSAHGRHAATFAGDLPEAGRWHLDYHLPGAVARGTTVPKLYGDLGSYDMTLHASGVELATVFDASVGEVGWNHVGSFTLPEGHVRLVVTNSGPVERLVVADAIRWRPIKEDAAPTTLGKTPQTENSE